VYGFRIILKIAQVRRRRRKQRVMRELDCIIE
jgi:hypothetical protein